MALAATTVGTVDANTGRLTGAATVRASAALTTSYVASSHFDATPFDVVSVLIALTWADSTSIEWYVEWSHDGTTWYRSLNVSPSGATNTTTANSQTQAVSASVNISDGTIPVEAAYVRVQVKKTAGVGADAASVVIAGHKRGR